MVKINGILLNIIMFFAGIVLISLLYANVVALTLALLGCWLISLKVWHAKKDVYCFMTGAVVGPAAEIICVYFGAWHYTNPTFLIPLWLLIAWGFASVLIMRTAELLAERL